MDIKSVLYVYIRVLWMTACLPGTSTLLLYLKYVCSHCMGRGARLFFYLSRSTNISITANRHLVMSPNTHFGLSEIRLRVPGYRPGMPWSYLVDSVPSGEVGVSPV